MTPEDLAHLRRARNLMDREYARPLDVSAMARVALMSSAHFSRQFRAAYGGTPYGYLMTRRIERATPVRALRSSSRARRTGTSRTHPGRAVDRSPLLT